MSAVPKHIQVFGWAAVTVAVATVVAAIWIAGTPAEVRARKADGQRVDDLVAIREALERHYKDSGSLPESLQDVEFRSRPDPDHPVPEDPVTFQPYGYERTGKTAYRLTAIFQTDPIGRRITTESDWQYPFTRYQRGENTFDIEIEQDEE